MIKLTARQQEVLDIVKQHIDDTGLPPTRAEIAKNLGFRSANAAEEHLKALARKGAIEMIPGASRGIRLPEEEKGLAVIGRVAAGSPVLATEHVSEYVDIPTELFYPQANYLLRVQGMSMKDIGILEDDLIAVHKTQTVRNGDIVIARVEEDVTVKRFEKQGKQILLHPENEEFETIVVDPSETHFEIEGLYVGCIRRNMH